jgi:hypothetical protein
MSKKEILIKEIEQAPKSFLDKALDFVRFIKTKGTQEKMNIAVASETSFAKDWLNPEEKKCQDL